MPEGDLISARLAARGDLLGALLSRCPELRPLRADVHDAEGS